MYLGPKDGLFSLEIIHGGFFQGEGSDRGYISGNLDYFDGCEVDAWSMLWIEDILKQLGHAEVDDLKVFWLLPGRGLANGLRRVKIDVHTNSMATLAPRFRTLRLYVHNNVITEFAEMDSLGKHELNANINFKKAHISEDYQVDNISDNDDEGAEFTNSDYEIDKGDDDLFEKWVDKDVVDKLVSPKGKQLSSAGEEDEKCHLSSEEGLDPCDTSSHDEEVQLKFKSFMPKDMTNPQFFVGMVFPTVEALRDAINDINEHSVKNRVAIKMPYNDKDRIRAHCDETCPSKLNASHDTRSKCFMIKTYIGEHRCNKKWELKTFTANYIANKYVETFRADDKMTIRNFARTVQKDFNLTPSRSKLARARRIALKKIYGDEIAQYNQLWDYAAELRRSNSGSCFFLYLSNGRFNTLYVSLDACKRGFKIGCRPLICLDGCHIKTKFGGHLLTAVGIDPSNCIFPIAMAVVEVESRSTWTWFLQTLKDDLHIVNTTPYTIMTDRQKVRICMYYLIYSMSYMI